MVKIRHAWLVRAVHAVFVSKNTSFTGATHCLIIGICLAILQGIFSTWWLHVHKQGPLESLWHKATWIG